LGLCGILIVLIGISPAGGDVAPPPIAVRLQAIRAADDDGGRRARVTPEQVREWVDFANRAFASAGIRIDFRPDEGDFIDLNNTFINSIDGGSRLADERVICNLAAARYPDKLVTFFRFGPGKTGTGGGFSWHTLRFVSMPGYDDAGHCGHPHTDAFAHEVGHYLGLAHTHGPVFDTLNEAEEFLAKKGGDPGVFDGDGLDDTPLDPLVRPLECDRVPKITLGAVDFVLPRRNLMSYYDERIDLTPSQIKIARWTLRSRMANRMGLSFNRATHAPIEAETMEVAEPGACECSVQSMDAWGTHRWSGGKQLFCDAGLGGWTALALPVEKAGAYSLSLYATRAPDFGKVQVCLGDKPLGDTFDAYAPIVEPSGKLTLGTIHLSRGTHLLRITVVGRNGDSTGYKFGIDCIEIASATPELRLRLLNAMRTCKADVVFTHFNPDYNLDHMTVNLLVRQCAMHIPFAMTHTQAPPLGARPLCSWWSRAALSNSSQRTTWISRRR